MWKTAFKKFYSVHTWILCPKYAFVMGKRSSKRRGGKILLERKYAKSRTQQEVFWKIPLNFHKENPRRNPFKYSCMFLKTYSNEHVQKAANLQNPLTINNKATRMLSITFWADSTFFFSSFFNVNLERSRRAWPYHWWKRR